MSLPPASPLVVNRYVRASRSSPSRLERDYNRTFEVEPDTLRGGALLIHGLTDAPYSMRAIAEQLRADGYYSLALRMPGHGTVPAGLVTSGADDWNAAVRLGRAARARRGSARGLPLVLVGYSNGGALVTRYTLDALEDASLPRPDRLVLVSPMIGVDADGAPRERHQRARADSLLREGALARRRARIQPVQVQLVSCQRRAQTYDITHDLQQRLDALGADGRLAQFPPVLTFQSLVDATVSTPAIVANLYDRLPQNGSALVLFDFNRHARLDPFIRPEDLTLMARMFEKRARNYRVTVVTNARPDTLDVCARDVAPGSTTPVDEPLGLAVGARHLLAVARRAAVSAG